MRKKLVALALIAAGLIIPIDLAWALCVAAPPGPERIVNSDAVFIGRVTQIEPVDVDAKPYPGAKETIKYRIAVVQIEKVVLGLKAEKSVRVGFIPPVQPQPGKPVIGRPRGTPQLEVGQEGLFMISKHGDGKFYQGPNYGYFVSKKDGTFDKEVKTAQHVVTILADTKKALQSKDADERLMAASIAVTKYRTPKGPSPKEEPIDAEESKLILNVIATSKWGQFRFGEANPQQLFFQLGVTEKDGFQQPRKITSPDDMKNAVQGWIRDHGDYRIKRFVQSTEK